MKSKTNSPLAPKRGTMQVIRVLALLMLMMLGGNKIAWGQTDRELLLEVIKQQNKISEQQTTMVTQQAVMATEIKALDKNIEKRFDLLNIIVGGIFGLFGVLIGVIVWDRRTATKPFETKTEQLEKANEKLQQEIDILKAKELKAEQLFRGFAEIEPRFAEMYRKATVL